METNDYVSHELAVKLKAAGFDLKCPAVWHFDGEDWNFIEDYGATFKHPAEIPHWNTSKVWGAHIYSAPTLWQAQKWLRENHHISIRVSYISRDKRWFADWLNLDSGEFDDFDETHSTYESALSAGLTAALELLGKDVEK